jgi:hypothetical protein
MKHIQRLPLLLILCLGMSAPSARNAFVTDAEPAPPSSIEPGKPWAEMDAALPPWPKDADLIELVPDGPPSTFRYFIDRRNLRIGADGVVRYTLVAESSNGARNLSVEGIRCTPKGSHKVYAYGVSGRFDRVEGDWRSISGQAGERYLQDLWRFHICVPQGFKPRPESDMIRSLTGRISPRQNMGFQSD